MEQAINPRKYRLRVHHMNNVDFHEQFVFAYSAEDAVFQIRHHLSNGGGQMFHRISYVGPVNPDCKCLNECRCGVAAQ